MERTWHCRDAKQQQRVPQCSPKLVGGATMTLVEHDEQDNVEELQEATKLQCLGLDRRSSWHTCTFYKFSLTYLIYFSYLSDSLTDTHKIYGSRPGYTLRCSTAELRIKTNPISHIFLIWAWPQAATVSVLYIRRDEPHMCVISDDELENDS